MSDAVFRFRTIEALLGERQELEKQVVYFASLHQLNDPMEGFRDTIWQGDEILWRNLLRNYVRTLHAAHGLAPLFHDVPAAEWMAGAMNAVFHLPNAPIKAELERVTAEFLARPVVRRTAEVLAGRSAPIRRNELLFLLRLLHPTAMQLSIRALEERGRPTGLSIPDEFVERSATNLEDLLKLPPHPAEVAEDLYGAAAGMNLQLDLIREANGASPSPGVVFLINDFASRFVDALAVMPFPDWHVACFVEDPGNAAMWSSYADNHTGVCLKFQTGRTHDGRPTLVLNGQRSWAMSGGQTKETRSFGPLAFSPVRYDGAYPEIPFFTSLGELPIPALEQFWFTEDGVSSPAAAALRGDDEQWRAAYWQSFDACVNRKTVHWAHEKELRLTIQSSLQPFDTPESRCLNYHFEDLAGIVFGVRTSAADKIRVMKAIERKCLAAGRRDFEFFQAAYSHRSREIETHSLGLIKFEGVPAGNNVGRTEATE